MNYIKVWCEYDISGQFGGNNNEEVFIVSDSLTDGEVETLVCKYLEGIWSEVKDFDGDDNSAENILEAGLAGWEYIVVKELK